MVQVKYVGDLPSVNIKILGSVLRGWDKDEVMELTEEQANVLKDNPEFEVLGASKDKKPVEVPKKEVVFDDDVVEDDE